MLKFSRLISSLAIAAVLAGGAVAAEKIRTTGEGALVIASRLVEEDRLGEAEAILRTLSAADPGEFDMRPVDALAAKIAYKKGETEEALRILESMVVYDPEDWRRRYDLTQLLVAEKKDRRARTHLHYLNEQDGLPDVVKTDVRSDLRLLDERRLVRINFRATAAPTSNVNSATRDESFDLFGFLPAQLDDEARQQSGLGVNYALSGVLTPKISEGIRGHIALRGQVADYGNIEFDQAILGAEFGIRLAQGSKAQGVLAATAERQYFGGNAYATSIGGRMSLHRVLNARMRLSGEVAAKDVAYDDQPDRDGPVFLVGTQLDVAVSPRIRVMGGVAAIREATQAESLANTQGSLRLGGLAALPWRINLGIQPEVTYRRFDKATDFYGGMRRKDTTLDLTTYLSIRDFDFRGFSPSLSYHYTDNQSTVDLFDYDRHALDIGLAKSF